MKDFYLRHKISISTPGREFQNDSLINESRTHKNGWSYKYESGH